MLVELRIVLSVVTNAPNMPRPKLRPPREAAKILGVSFATVKQWIYKGTLRTVKTLGGHHRVLEDDIEKHLRLKLIAESRKKWGLGPQKISEGNQLLGCIVDIKFDGLIAQVTYWRVVTS